MLQTPDTTLHTKAQSLSAMGNVRQQQLQDKILEICLAAQRNGCRDLSGREIQARYEAYFSVIEGHPVRLDASTISSRVNSLVTAGRLVRTELRACSITGRNISPVAMPMKQVRLLG
jgi:hypothetical protein